MALRTPVKLKPKVRRKANQAAAAEKARKIKGKEAADITIDSDVVHREAVRGERAVEAHTPSSQRKSGLLAGGKSAGLRTGWRRKIKKLDRLDDSLNTVQGKIDKLLAKSRQTTDTEGKIAIHNQIANLKTRLKSIKEKMKLERVSMTDMKKRHGPGIQVKKGGTVKRSTGGLLGMGAALRGGGAVRKRSY